MYDHLVFLSDSDSTQYALTVTFGRGLNNNTLVRAERDFFGFVYNSKFWVALPYMKMKHDSTRLDISYNYLFGGLSWNSQHDGGEVTYDWRDTKVGLKFSELKPVQSLRDGDWKLRSHAIGKGTLYWQNDAIPGTVYYELFQLEGANPIGVNQNGETYLNNDWIALVTKSHRHVITSTDTTEAGNRIIKDFFAMSDSKSLMYADGSEHVQMTSDGFRRDYNIYDWMALNKHLSVPELGVAMELSYTESRIFYTDGYCVGIIQGSVSVDNQRERVWGVIEHRQKPKSEQSALK
jgi:hypothetical protein